jgi:hypothetical protein
MLAECARGTRAVGLRSSVAATRYVYATSGTLTFLARSEEAQVPRHHVDRCGACGVCMGCAAEGAGMCQETDDGVHHWAVLEA